MGRGVLSLAVAATLAGFALWVHLAQFSATLQWDSHVFVLIGRYVGQGLLPYRDLYDLKPPGIYWYVAGIFSALPAAIWGIRIADFVCYLCGAAAFYGLCRNEAGRAFSVIGTAAWLYFGHHPTFDIGGVYTEEYSALCAIGAVSFAAAYARSGRVTMVLLSGLAAAAAALFKHPGAGVILPALVLIAARPSLRVFVLFIAAVLIPPSLVVSYFWAQGAADAFLDCNLYVLLAVGGLNEPGRAGLGDRLVRLVQETWAQGQLFPVLAGAIALGVPVAVLRPTRLRLAAAVWLVIDLLGVAAQNHYFAHHYIQVFPSIFLVGTLGAAWLLQPRRADHWFIALSRAAVCALAVILTWPILRATFEQQRTGVSQQWSALLLGPDAWQQNPGRSYEEEIGRYLRDRTQPGDRLHVHGWNGTTLGIYWVADRQPASRYFYEVPFGLDRQAQLRDLQHNRPEYVVLVQQQPFIFLTPWLTEAYTVEAVKWQDYRTEIWVRTRAEPLGTGSAVGLAPAREWAGLALLPAAGSGEGLALLRRAGAPRRGRWTSPVVPVRSDDGRILVDWNPRTDLAWNRTAQGFPQAKASYTCPETDVRAVLGFPTVREHWSSCPGRGADSVTVDLGFPAVIDRIVLDQWGDGRQGLDAGFEIDAGSVWGPADALHFAPIVGTWEPMQEGSRAYRFPPQVVTAVRVSPAPGNGLRRIRVLPVGMGITAHYRTGPTADLESAPWQPILDGEGSIWLIADRYVQVQLELWSKYQDQSPVLRSVQIGRTRFDGLAGAAAMSGDPSDLSPQNLLH